MNMGILLGILVVLTVIGVVWGKPPNGPDLSEHRRYPWQRRR